ncbi:MAG: HDOD domain-containing protein [Spirochaetales bacterium]|jgi:putative nucleotidyltransferase with HDIG domain|nr:HDOD domain-containing protein [Spirochaetales bacterium]
MDEKKLAKLHGYIEKMPSLPTTVSRILEICNLPQTIPADLNQVISLDPVLMGKVLKLINSAYYGLNQEITSLVRAIIMLGINTVKNLALSTAVLGTFDRQAGSQALNMDGFWRHSLGVAVCSKLIAKKRKLDPKKWEDYFIAGLLHDLGKIPLNNQFPDDYVRVIETCDRERIPLCQAEKKIFDLNHAEVGSLIVSNWRLDNSILDVTGRHHDYENYEGEHTELLYSVVLADFFVNETEVGFSGNRWPQKPSSLPEKVLNFSLEAEKGIEAEVTAEIEKASIFLKLTKKG